MFKKGDAAYGSQCDTIFKLENLQLQVLLVIFEDKTLFQCICEDLINDSFIIAMRSCRKNPPNDFDKFEFCDGFLYHDGLLYVPKGLAWF